MIAKTKLAKLWKLSRNNEVIDRICGDFKVFSKDGDNFNLNTKDCVINYVELITQSIKAKMINTVIYNNDIGTNINKSYLKKVKIYDSTINVYSHGSVWDDVEFIDCRIEALDLRYGRINLTFNNCRIDSLRTKESNGPIKFVDCLSKKVSLNE